MSPEDKQLPAPINLKLVPVLTEQEAREQLKEFQQFVKGYLVPKQDIGVIPGTSNEVLLQPGAQKLAEIYGLYPDFEIIQSAEEWEKEPPLFDYTIKVTLKRRADNIIVSSGIGSCNSWESKYRWREAKRTCPSCGQASIKTSKAEWGGGYYCDKKLSPNCGSSWKALAYKDQRGNEKQPSEADKETCVQIASQPAGRVANDDIASQKNTVLKMAKKRAFVDAVISATRSSGIFTQDVEDFVSGVEISEKRSETTDQTSEAGTDTVDVETGEVFLATQEDCAELTAFGKARNVSAKRVKELCLGQSGVDEKRFFDTFTMTHLANVKAAIIEEGLNKEFAQTTGKSA